MRFALAMALVIFSNTFYSYGESLTGAFLPELATADGMGKVSGWGWGFGYIGGMLALGLCLAYVLWAQARGLPAAHFVPVTMLITAALYGVAACATFALLPERALPQKRGANQSAWQQPVHHLPRGPRLSRLHVACWPAPSATRGGGRGGDHPGGDLCRAGDRLPAERDDGADLRAQHRGGARCLRLSAICRTGSAIGARWPARWWRGIAVCLIAASVTTKGGFWWAASIAGLAMGSSQSAGRAMTGILAPPRQLAEFFGLWTFANPGWPASSGR